MLGEDEGLSPELRDAFRASGLYHLLAVSGQNVIFVAVGILGLAWVVGVPRWLGELGALAGIGSYVLAVGAQPSVIRAGIAGALGSIAWLAARQHDRWHFLLVGALVLLAWNPYTLLDAGFQLSFAAVVAIFVDAAARAAPARGLPGAEVGRRGGGGVARLRARHGPRAVAAVRADTALLGAGQRPRRAGGRPAARPVVRGCDRRRGVAAGRRL